MAIKNFFEGYEFTDAAKDVSHTTIGPDVSEPSLSALQYMDARTRWGVMAMSAILGFARVKGSLREFLNLADKTQREQVAKIAREVYLVKQSNEPNTLAANLAVANLGTTGCGFEYKVALPATNDPTRMTSLQDKCPMVAFGNRAGYNNGDPAFNDMRMWCDAYDNFENQAVAPSQVIVHSHCLGVGDSGCRPFAERCPPGLERKPGEELYGYLRRMMEKWRAENEDPAQYIVGKTEEELRASGAAAVARKQANQAKVYPTLREQKRVGATIFGRIAAASKIMAGELLGWDVYVKEMAAVEGPALQKEAKAKAEELGITGDTVHDAVALHQALLNGMEFGAYSINASSKRRVEGTCTHCPIIKNANDADLQEGAKGIMTWCSAARTYEAQAISKDITHTYTHCLGRGDKVCRWVIEKK